MLRSKDSIMRYGGMFAIGCAYAGTGNNSAIRKLLHYSVSDVSDDVKRAALMNLGFVLFRRPEKIPELVKQLAESYNPHIRYGAAFAVGIGCAGTGLTEALKLLAPLTNDKVDFVRQGALIALSMVFIQITEAQEPKVATIKKLYTKMTEDKHEEILSRMGSILAQGIINAAGRNATISLTTRDGNLRQNAVVGLVLFLQHWYWYPLLNFLSLALTPTALIGVTEQLKVPKSLGIVSNAKPSLYKYPDFLKKEEGKEKEKVETAVLSTTAKVKARVGRKQKAEGGAAVESPSKTPADTEMLTEEEKKKKDEEEAQKAAQAIPEPEFQELKNPSRVLKAQEKKIQYKPDSRWFPVLENRFSGFVVLRDQNPSSTEPEQFYDDEERDPNAPNPDRQSDLLLPEEFEFDPAVQNAP
jgi:26S proteasome regulatory subunit N2